MPSPSWATADVVTELQARIGEASAEAGRDPAAIRRIYNLNGTITDSPTRDLLQGPPGHWVKTLTGFASELGFDTFIFWPGDGPLFQRERFANEVMPRLREG